MGKIVKCIDCKNAELIQYSKYNPIIAMCKVKGNDRDVAKRERICEMYECKDENDGRSK